MIPQLQKQSGISAEAMKTSAVPDPPHEGKGYCTQGRNSLKKQAAALNGGFIPARYFALQKGRQECQPAAAKVMCGVF